MDGVIRYTAGDALTKSTEDALAGLVPGHWVRAADFDERQKQAKQREVALQDRLTAAEQQLDERSGTCEWKDEDGVGTWHSACGVVWSFHEDGPAENGMNFCHSCGKQVAVSEVMSDRQVDDNSSDELESKALAIYEGWSNEPGYKPWVAGGNSLMQDRARAIARHLLNGACHE